MLRTAVASAAPGIGGIGGELASHSLEHGLYKTFADLAALEAGDIAAEQAFNAASADTARAITVGTDDALKESAAQNVKTALTSVNQPGSTGKFNVFAEAMRLETISEQLATATAFHLGAESTYESVAMAGRIMSLEAVERDLAARPDIFHRSLTEAYMRILHDSGATAGRDGRPGGGQDLRARGHR